eukprot:TRINITY_DN30691_c0_g1_i1.p1 TRINITY_DN30691_c0_g1~~TRINITY_DN30691_c0_g1_i1.p1  ORF type:complete len:109 (-),score=5.48 TRINITY_DN30691_c0_g1_i1:27-353(-)
MCIRDRIWAAIDSIVARIRSVGEALMDTDVSVGDDPPSAAVPSAALKFRVTMGHSSHLWSPKQALQVPSPNTVGKYSPESLRRVAVVRAPNASEPEEPKATASLCRQH